MQALEKKSKTDAYNDHRIEDNSKNINLDELVRGCLLKRDQCESIDKFFNWDANCFDFTEEKDLKANLKIIESILDPKNEG